MEKIFVTGGLGFIGSTIIEHLIEKGGFEITVFDDLSTGYRENIGAVKEKINLVEGDIRNLEQLKNAMAGSKFVFHMAALSYVSESIQKPEAYNNVNIDGTLNVLKAAKENSVERVLFPSTCIVYGNTDVIPIPETTLLNPNTPYGLTKQVGEFYAKFFHEVHGLDTICLRIFNAYGPRMQNRVLSIFIKQMLQKQSPTINGLGTQKRDFVFVEDIVEGFLKAMEAQKRHAGKSFNIGTGKGLSLIEMVEKINKCLGTDIKPVHKKDAIGEIGVIIADTRLAEKELGFKAKTGFDKGLKKTVEWFNKARA